MFFFCRTFLFLYNVLACRMFGRKNNGFSVFVFFCRWRDEKTTRLVFNHFSFKYYSKIFFPSCYLKIGREFGLKIEDWVFIIRFFSITYFISNSIICAYRKSKLTKAIKISFFFSSKNFLLKIEIFFAKDKIFCFIIIIIWKILYNQ